MNWVALGKYVADVGVPAAIAFYLLVRLDGTLRDVGAALWALKAASDALVKLH
jgi:hypothetical protein